MGSVRTWMARRFTNWWQGRDQASGLSVKLLRPSDLWMTSVLSPPANIHFLMFLGGTGHVTQKLAMKMFHHHLFCHSNWFWSGQITQVGTMRASPKTFIETITEEYSYSAGIASWWLIQAWSYWDHHTKSTFLKVKPTRGDAGYREHGETESCWSRTELIHIWAPGSSHAWSLHSLFRAISW